MCLFAGRSGGGRRSTTAGSRHARPAKEILDALEKMESFSFSQGETTTAKRAVWLLLLPKLI
jgi:hypothetical protein